MHPQYWILVYLGLLVGFLLVAAVRDRRFDLLSALVLFNLPAALYSIGAAINYYWLHVEVWRLGYLTTVSQLEELLPLTVVALVAFNTAYLLTPARRIALALPTMRTDALQDALLAQWAFAAMIVAFAFTLLGFSYFDLSTVFGSPYGTLSMAQQSLIHFAMFVESSVILIATYLSKHDRWRSPFAMAFVFAAAAYVGFVVLLGKRAAILYVLLGVLAGRHLVGKRLTLRGALMACGLLIGVSLFMELGRASPVRTFSSMFEHATYMVEHSAELEQPNSFVARVLQQGDMLGTLGVIIDRTPADRLQYGLTYLEAIGRLAPGFLWRGIFPQGLSSLAGEHLAFFYLAEAYLNFGYAGLAIVPAVFGCFIRVIDRWKDARTGIFLVAVTFATIAGSIAYLPRLDLGGVVKDIVYRCAFVFLLFTVTRAHVDRWRPAGGDRRVAAAST